MGLQLTKARQCESCGWIGSTKAQILHPVNFASYLAAGALIVYFDVFDLEALQGAGQWVLAGAMIVWFTFGPRLIWRLDKCRDCGQLTMGE